jgi:acyl-CoA thioesterase FadM
MKSAQIAAAVAMGLALGFGQVAVAQKTMDNVMTMDTDKGGMISKAEAMRMFETKFDAMMRQKGIQKLSAKDVQTIIDDIAKTYGTAQ